MIPIWAALLKAVAICSFKNSSSKIENQYNSYRCLTASIGTFISLSRTATECISSTIKASATSFMEQTAPMPLSWMAVQ